MPPPQEPERRKDFALRALYGRVATLEAELDTLKKLHGLGEEKLKALGDATVSYKALAATVVTLALALFAGAWRFSASVQEAAQKTVAAQSATVAAQSARFESFMDAQRATNVKTEALYLLSVERKPREEARAVVLQTAKEK